MIFTSLVKLRSSSEILRKRHRLSSALVRFTDCSKGSKGANLLVDPHYSRNYRRNPDCHCVRHRKSDRHRGVYNCCCHHRNFRCCHRRNFRCYLLQGNRTDYSMVARNTPVQCWLSGGGISVEMKIFLLSGKRITSRNRLSESLSKKTYNSEPTWKDHLPIFILHYSQYRFQK